MAGDKELTISSQFSILSLMAKIPLSGRLGHGKHVLVDDEDVVKVAGIRWHLSDTGYAVNRKAGKTIRMHRVINNTPITLFTDHKNHNKLDNRKENLRSVTQKENMSNYKGAKGYVWDKSKQKWMVRYKKQFYGRYDTEIEAINAYKLACSGVPYIKSRRKFWHLPTGISKQFGKYRVRPQKDGVKYWLGAYSTVQEAEAVLKEWKKRG